MSEETNDAKATREDQQNPAEPTLEDKSDGDATREDQAGSGTPAWRRMARVGSPRATRGKVVAALLALLLGFAMVTQVRQTRTSGLENLRQSDLVAVLGNVNNQSTRLQREANDLTRTRDGLRSGSGGAAQKAAQERLTTLGILAGTVAATGPGVRIVINDPAAAVGAPNLLDAVQELRDAGAEAIQIGDVRVVASTWFGTDAQNNLVADGKVLRAPYTILAIGDPSTMATAMAIPGGVTETMQQLGAQPAVTQQKQITVSALRPLEAARYAQPSAPQ